MSATAAKVLSQQLTSFVGVQEVIHSTPGRIRLRIPSLKGNPSAAEEWTKRIVRLDGMIRAEANPLLGTALAVFDPSAVDANIVVAASTRCFDFEARMRGQQPLILRNLKTMRFALDQAVVKTSHGTLNIQTVMALWLLWLLIKALRGAAGNLHPMNVVWWFLQSIR